MTRIVPLSGLVLALVACGSSNHPTDAGTLTNAASCTTGNVLTAAEQSFETGVGRWSGWYSAQLSRSSTTAQDGTSSLKISTTAADGWGIAIDAWPGLDATAGSRTLSFWARLGNGNNVNAKLVAHWEDANGNDLLVSEASLAKLTTTWQQASAQATAPANTRYVRIELVGSSAESNDVIYVDNVVVGASCAADAGGTPVDAGPGTVDAGAPVDAGSPPVDAGSTGSSDAGSPGNGDGGVGAVGYPTTPPAAICGDSAVLDGPATAPAGAVTIQPGQNLDDATQSHPAGTTFWLAPGTHTLGSSQYSQVIPKDGNTYIGAPGAILDGKHVNAYAFTGGASHVTIQHLTVQNFVAPRDEGVVNHDSGAYWTIEYSTLKNNGGAAAMIGAYNTLRYNCIASNGQYGFNAYNADDTVSHVVLDHNEIAGNNTDDWESKVDGCGCTGGGKFWVNRNVQVTNNWVHDNKSIGLWADTNNVEFLFEGNLIENNDGPGIMYEISYNAMIRKNTFRRNALKAGQQRSADDNFPDGAIYLSESGGEVIGSYQYSTLEIHDNLFEDNFNGVILWENADRYCGSPANTSDGYCPLVGTSSTRRWKTENVSVYRNTFRFNPAAIGCTNSNCGRNALFSNWGSYPSNSPYLGDVIEKAITYSQNNHFHDNLYIGPWLYMPYEIGNNVSFSKWQASPYLQDAASVKQ